MDDPILVVDDDPRVRQLIRWALEDEGFAVDTASDGRQAVEHANQRRPSLVVLDLNLPVLNGARVADALQHLAGGVPPILVITADESGAEAAAQMGAVSLLRKPFGVDELMDAVRRGLALDHRPSPY